MNGVKLMKNVVYHGSPNGNIKELMAQKSFHSKDCIFASKNLVVALLFMGKGNGDLDTLISIENDKIQLVERRMGVLNSLYHQSGYLYELDGSTFFYQDNLWPGEVISFEKRIKPLKKIFYENILATLIEEEKKEILLFLDILIDQMIFLLIIVI